MGLVSALVFTPTVGEGFPPAILGLFHLPVAHSSFFSLSMPRIVQTFWIPSTQEITPLL